MASPSSGGTPARMSRVRLSALDLSSADAAESARVSKLSASSMIPGVRVRDASCCLRNSSRCSWSDARASSDAPPTDCSRSRNADHSALDPAMAADTSALVAPISSRACEVSLAMRPASCMSSLAPPHHASQRSPRLMPSSHFGLIQLRMSFHIPGESAAVWARVSR